MTADYFQLTKEELNEIAKNFLALFQYLIAISVIVQALLHFSYSKQIYIVGWPYSNYPVDLIIAGLCYFALVKIDPIRAFAWFCVFDGLVEFSGIFTADFLNPLTFMIFLIGLFMFIMLDIKPGFKVLTAIIFYGVYVSVILATWHSEGYFPFTLGWAFVIVGSAYFTYFTQKKKKTVSKLDTVAEIHSQ